MQRWFWNARVPGAAHEVLAVRAETGEACIPDGNFEAQFEGRGVIQRHAPASRDREQRAIGVEIKRRVVAGSRGAGLNVRLRAPDGPDVDRVVVVGGEAASIRADGVQAI